MQACQSSLRKIIIKQFNEEKWDKYEIQHKATHNSQATEKTKKPTR